MNFLRFVILAATATMLSFAAGDPFLGTWKPANVSKWKTSPGMPEVRKSESLTFTAPGKDQYAIQVTLPDGKAGQNFTLPADGKEHPTTGPNPGTLKVARIGEKHLQVTRTSAKGSTTDHYEISADGKTMTETRKGKGTASGRMIDEVYLYEKAK